jgi:hypothetical protein
MTHWRGYDLSRDKLPPELRQEWEAEQLTQSEAEFWNGIQHATEPERVKVQKQLRSALRRLNRLPEGQRTELVQWLKYELGSMGS